LEQVVSVARSLLLVCAGVALFLSGWWLGREGRPAAPAAEPPAVISSPTLDSLPRPPPPAAVGNGNYLPPDIATATPAEVQAMRDAEVERSAASVPKATYKGIDGKTHSFHYDAAQDRIAAARQQERREMLMRELQADPARFAREHQLSLKEVQWIVDGDADFPDRLLTQ
jgi:hypothetical protein